MNGLAFATLLDRYDCAMDPIGKYEPCANGGYKIALVCDPFHYYHVLRQNRTGIWSHFLMGSGVTKFDVRGQTILDPEEAVFANFPAEAPNSGSPEVEFDAASFVGFFEVYAT